MMECPRRPHFSRATKDTFIVCTACFAIIFSPVLGADDVAPPVEAALVSEAELKEQQYTINFSNVSIIEFIRFVSKISNLNFVFEEKDLPFNVTIVSEEPVSAQNVMSALAQVLRVHGLTLLEQGNNVLIINSATVHEMSPLFSGDISTEKEPISLLVTRVFRIKHASLTTLATILKPFVSTSSIIEVSAETRQIIVTDITTNVDKIADLIATLDSPHVPLDIDAYVVKNSTPDDLINLTRPLLLPFAEGNPINFVAQEETNSIFIVSTPFLIEKAMAILEDLDKPASQEALSHQTKFAEKKNEILIYTPKNRPAQAIQSALKDLTQSLAASKAIDPKLLLSLETLQWQPQVNSLIFLGEPATLLKVQQILQSLDTLIPAVNSVELFIYKPQNSTEEQISAGLHQILETLDAKNSSDKGMIDALENIQWNAGMSSFVVSTDPQTIERLRVLFATLDAPHKASASSAVFVYKLDHATGEQVLSALKSVSEKVLPNTLANQNFLEAIKHIEWVPASKSLLITGAPDAVDRLKVLIASLDVPAVSPGKETSFFIYTPQFLDPKELEASLNSVKEDLQQHDLIDPDLVATLSSVRFVSATNSLVFTGSANALDKLKQLLATIDIASSENAANPIHKLGETTFIVYSPQHMTSTQLMTSLQHLAAQLGSSTAEDTQLKKTIETMRYIKETNSLFFVGPEVTLKKLLGLIQKLDVGTALNPSQESVPSRAASTFVIYTPKNINGEELISILCHFGQTLKNSGVSDTPLFDVINNVRWMEKSSSLVVSGEADAVKKVEDLLVKFDVAGQDGGIGGTDTASFLVYKLQYHQGSDVQAALKQVAAGLKTGGENLLNAVNSLQWIQVTNSLIGTGTPAALGQLKNLISNLDVPLRQVFIEVLIITTNLENTLDFGLMWGGQAQYMNRATMGTGNFPLANNSNTGASSPVGAFAPNLGGVNATNTPKGGIYPNGNTGTNGMVPFTNGFDLGVIGDIIMHKGKSFISLGSLVNALQLDLNSTIVMNPKLITQDNRPSTLFVGQNIPFAGAFVETIGQSSQQTTGNLEYRDVGVNLTITPMLGDNDVVTLDIVYDMSEQIPNTTQNNSTSNLNGIQTSHTHMETRVHLPNQHFVALSGMLQDQKTHYRTAIPCLGGLPVIGALFSENDKSNTKYNVMIFLRPHIIQSYKDYQQLTEHQEWLYKDSVKLPVLKEEFEQGLDYVKLPENE